MWPGDVCKPPEESDISDRRAAVCARAGGGERTKDLFAKVFTAAFFKSHLKIQSVDCSRGPKAWHARKRKHARRGRGVERQWGLRLKRGGGGGAQTEGEGGIVFVNPPHIWLLLGCGGR